MRPKSLLFIMLTLDSLLPVLGEAFSYLDSPIVRVTGADLPTPYAKSLEDHAFPVTHDIVDTVKRLLNVQSSAAA